MAVLTLLVATLRREIEAYAAGEGSLAVVVALIAGSLAALLILGAEFFFIKDVFNNRMNTVFKLYYQAWIFLAISGGFALYYMTTALAALEDGPPRLARLLELRRRRHPGGRTGLSRRRHVRPHRRTSACRAHIDGLAWAKQQDAGDYDAAKWLADNAKPTDVIVETVGNQSIGWEWGSTGRISSWTGIATVFAWPGHEQQWRGGDELTRGRLEDVDLLYKTENVADVQNIVAKYGINYIVVGSLEREVYSQAALEKFDGMFPKVYPAAGTESSVAIYQARK